MDVDSDSNQGGRASVGRSIEQHQIYDATHPAYKAFSSGVAAELAKLANREAVRKESAARLVVPFSLTSDEKSLVEGNYPEFSLVPIPLGKPVHSYFEANRLAANELIAGAIDTYAVSVVHFGGSQLSTIVASRDHHHLESSNSIDFMVHSSYGTALNANRLFRECLEAARHHGITLPRTEYDKMVTGSAHRVCVNPSLCTHPAQGLCVDLSVVEMSPVQVAIAMQQHGAEVCQGFFMYHPIMLIQDQGWIEDSGVYFRSVADRIQFDYPEGRCGVSGYSRSVWSKWLASHTFNAGPGEGSWYQLELLNHREMFMFFRMVKVPKPQSEVRVKHALELVDSDEYVLVKSWRLRRGFLSKTEDSSEWEPHNFLVKARVERRVREFAMQLQPESFTRHALKMQIRVVNNRWVVNGTTVNVAMPLDPQEIEDLTTAIFARVFVDRYESSRLSAEMMSVLKSLAGFNSMSFLGRVGSIACILLKMLYTATLGKIDKGVRFFIDYVRDFFRTTPTARSVEIVRAPMYVTLTSAVTGWSKLFGQFGETYFRASDIGMELELTPNTPGYALLSAVRRFTKGLAISTGYERARMKQNMRDMTAVTRISTDILDTGLNADEQAYSDFASAVASTNEVDSAPASRARLEFQTVVRQARETIVKFRTGKHPDPVGALNQMYLEMLPMVANQSLEFDSHSLSLDPQDRTMAAPYLRMPKYFGVPPKTRSYYKSFVKALNVPKRQNTSQELLTAISARNLSAPVVSLLQNSEVVIRDVFDTFIDQVCVEDARAKLLSFQADPVALCEDALKDWAKQANPGVVERLRKEMVEHSTTLGDKRVNEYLVMIKSDVKSTMNNKPVTEPTAPQVIVYHDKWLSAMYSSIMRVLVRRFVSLLKPNYHVNLYKNLDDISEFLTGIHPFGEEGLSYLENDFSKYDKSQSDFAFELEHYVFQQLGMNQEMLSKWLDGHVDCSLRSVSLGLSLHVMYQRKSGDATTAFGNVILNLLSVTYAYAGTQVVWAVFMGDDSIICAKRVNATDRAVRLLAEVFNLIAKNYVTLAPYFASNFIVIDDSKMQANLCPDIVKRIERLSMYIEADEPSWNERHQSYLDAMAVYGDQSMVMSLARLVPQRYEVSEGFVRDAAEALGSFANDFNAFRAIWAEKPETLGA